MYSRLIIANLIITTLQRTSILYEITYEKQHNTSSYDFLFTISKFENLYLKASIAL